MFVLANVIQPLIDVFEALLIAIHSVIPSWGLSIIALTVVVRAALLPLTFKQLKSMQNMQRLAPKIKELQAKYKDDKQRMNQEMMKFYKENNVNPLSSCLPLVAQFPVFIALFYMLRTDLKHDICPTRTTEALAHGVKLANVHCGEAGSFLFIPYLTNKATGSVLVVLIILYIGTQVASTLMMSVTADKTQRRIFLLLPFLFVTFILRFPAGLIVYWITTNTWTIAQQYIVRRTVGPIQPPALAAAGAGDGKGGGGPGGLLAGLLGGGGGSARSDKAKTDGKPVPEPAKVGAKAAAGEGNGGKPKAKPPPPPRKKRKQRSGRRR